MATVHDDLLIVHANRRCDGNAHIPISADIGLRLTVRHCDKRRWVVVGDIQQDVGCKEVAANTEQGEG